MSAARRTAAPKHTPAVISVSGLSQRLSGVRVMCYHALAHESGLAPRGMQVLGKPTGKSDAVGGLGGWVIDDCRIRG